LHEACKLSDHAKAPLPGIPETGTGFLRTSELILAVNDLPRLNVQFDLDQIRN
jgi:hypothetical protein